MKKAIITGITGQDGSFLAELLLSKGYEVYGLVRRSSSLNRQRIDHLRMDANAAKVFLYYGDLTDASSIWKMVYEVQPDEVYHLAAQSNVNISFDMPEFTADANGLGTLRLLEALKNIKKPVRFYMAASSEMFGSTPPPQNETSLFNPRSMYAISKVFSFDTTRLYREAYGMFASNGVLFNHECISENTPIIVRNKKAGIISVKRVKDVRRARKKGKNVQQWLPTDIEIWDGEQFVALTFITATRRKKEDSDFHCRLVNTRHGIVETTNHHNMLDENGTKAKTRSLRVGDRLLHKAFPAENSVSAVSQEEALFLGMMVGDGYIPEEREAQFSNNDGNLLRLCEDLWKKIALGSVRLRGYKTEYGRIKQLFLKGNPNYLELLRREIYTYDGFKKIPDRILNAPKETKLAFLRGYNMSDGLQANPCIYEFKNFKTDSALLAQGLLFLVSTTTGQDFNLTFEYDEKQYGYYSINFLSPVNNLAKEEQVLELLGTGVSQREINRETGISRSFIGKISNGGHAAVMHHLSKPKGEVKKLLYHRTQPEWVYDIETESRKFMAGIGAMIVSNSERRGENFVTRKITLGVAKIKAGLMDKLYLGNLEGRRDWGYAPEYVEAMWKILQHEKPDDFVIATGESHSVREFLEEVFQYAGLGDWRPYVVPNVPRFLRPAEVEHLTGNSAKAKRELGWQQKIGFKELVRIMCDIDLKAAGITPPGEGFKILQERFPNPFWKYD